MVENLKNVLVRGRSKDLNREYGAVIVNEILRREVTFKVHRAAGEMSEKTLTGIALIGESTAGSPHNLEPFARNIGNITITIERLPEFLFMPVNTHRDPMVGLWTVECVPFTDWFRLLVKSDAQILREAGMK